MYVCVCDPRTALSSALHGRDENDNPCWSLSLSRRYTVSCLIVDRGNQLDKQGL